MDVYLLPVTPAQPGVEPAFEMYCEPAPDHDEEQDDAPDSAPRSFFARIAAAPRSLFARAAKGFKQALAEGEEEERRQEKGEPEAQASSGSRFGRFVKRKLAAAVAEQRVLWNLRHATAALLHHPATITSSRALEIATAEFKKDFSKHRMWCHIDAAIVVIQTPLAFVPGPNFLAYYFIFRSVGHFFSYQGARKGMDATLWTAVPSTPLADLQQALSLEDEPRAERIEGIAQALGLERLAVFMRRVVARPRPA